MGKKGTPSLDFLKNDSCITLPICLECLSQYSEDGLLVEFELAKSICMISEIRDTVSTTCLTALYKNINIILAVLWVSF